MKARFILGSMLASALVFGGCTPKDGAKTSAPQKMAQANKSKGPALWLVQDADTKVYLFGTVHLLKPEMKWQNEKFDKAFTASGAIYQEADVTSPQAQQSMMKAMTTLAMFTDGRVLNDLLDDEQEREVNEAAAIVGIAPANLQGMKPWVAGLSLMQMQIAKSGYKSDSGVEMVINTKAKAAKKEIRYFETAAQQVRFMGELPEASQIEFLVQGAVAIEDDPDMLDELVGDWAEGDVEGIAEIMSGVDDWGDMTVYNTLLVGRNRVWTKKISQLMDDEAGTFMVAVGAGHLAGEDSVIAMLRDNGETVTRQ